MNKISKKIVALVTMAAFVLTLVPAAAFAANTVSAVDPAKSSVQTEKKNAQVDTGDKVSYKLNLYNAAGTGLDDQEVYIWVEDTEGNVVDAVDYYSSNTVATPNTTAVEYIGKDKVFHTQQSDNGAWRALAINEPGDYVIKAGVIKDENNAIDSLDKLVELKGSDQQNTVKVTVPTIHALTLSCADGTVEATADDHVFTLNLIGDNFIANTSDTCTVTGNIEDDQNRPIKNKEVKLSSADKALWFTGEASDGVVTTDANGDFSFAFKMNDNRNVPVSITIDDEVYTLRVIKEETRAYDIDTVTDGGYVLAGDSANWDDWSAVNTVENTAVLDDALTFSVNDIKGNAVGIEDMSSEPAVDGYVAPTPAHNQYVDVMTRPDDSTLSADDLYLVEVSDGVYSLEYSYADADERAADLVPGKYEVSVSLLSGDSAVASFVVADYGTTKDLELEMTATDASTAVGTGATRTVDITDEVTLGQIVEISAVYVDENGIKLNAPDDEVSFGGNGKAVVDGAITDNTFATKADIAANESLIGTTIEVIATSQAVNKTVIQKLTVVDSYNALSLEFDPTEGPVNEDNEVTVSVVKEDGSRAQVTGQIVSAYVDEDSVSNKDAKVYVDGVGNDVTNGRGTITVYASADTTADIVVAVKDNSNSGLYAATLEYTAGNVDVTAHHEVTMTIGSSQYVVDKQLFTMDAAPYVDSNWRTMVPIRALAEAFDADVEWNNDDRTVTIKYENETIVMTVGEKDYTINGETATMDTEAVIQGDRTYVPIRFAAEAMGFTVTPLYNANSSTASVVFQS